MEQEGRRVTRILCHCDIVICDEKRRWVSAPRSWHRAPETPAGQEGPRSGTLPYPSLPSGCPHTASIISFNKLVNVNKHFPEFCEPR